MWLDCKFLADCEANHPRNLSLFGRDDGDAAAVVPRDLAIHHQVLNLLTARRAGRPHPVARASAAHHERRPRSLGIERRPHRPPGGSAERRPPTPRVGEADASIRKFASPTSTTPGTGSSRSPATSRRSGARPRTRAAAASPSARRSARRAWPGGRLAATRAARARPPAPGSPAPRQHLLQRGQTHAAPQHRRHGVEPGKVDQPAAVRVWHQHRRQLDGHARRQPLLIVSPRVGLPGQPFGQGRRRQRPSARAALRGGRDCGESRDRRWTHRPSR